MAVINAGMRKVIKGMVITCQTAQFVSLMPKPKDFVTRIVGDVVLLSSKVQKLSDDINKLLDSYSDIPINYLMTQVNSITGSLTGVVDRVNIYTQNAINQGMSVGENTLNTISEITGTAIDTVNVTSQAVSSLSSTIAHTSSEILGKKDVAEDIQSATEVILEWTDNGFQEIKTNATEPLNQAIQTVTDAKTSAMNAVNNTLTGTTDAINNAQQWVENLLQDLKSKMDELSAKLDGGFKDVTGLNSVSTGASKISEELLKDNDSPSAQAVTAISSSLSEVLKNFSISKVITAFAGVITQSAIVKLGLDQLPPIDFESMLCQVRSDMITSNDEFYAELSSMVSDIDKFNESLQKAEERDYTDKNYKEFISQFSEDIKKKRDAIRLSMKYKGNLTNEQKESKDNQEKLATKSAIKEIKKFKKKVKSAKQTKQLSSIIGGELKNLGKEAEYCCNSIKSDWNNMMDQYKNAIKEIKGFFINGGDGDMFIDDCCDAINKDCDDIKTLCSNLGTQLIGTTLKVAMPADLGPVFPNPIYKLASFWMDIKTIFKFIKDLITLVIDILNNINKLARIMLNGINNLKDIIKQLMEILGIKWFMDLIQSIIDLFESKISDAKLLLENQLSPVYYKDTEEYNNTLEALESILSEDDTVKALSSDQLKKISGTAEKDNNMFYTIEISTIISATSDLQRSKEESYENMISDLESKGDELVAYRSPILESSESTSSVSELADGTGNINFDVKFIGWHYFHPNIDHTKNKYYGSGIIGTIMKKIKSKIIEKAARKSNKTSGGVNMLKRKKIKKDISYDVFYWYTYYTEDIEKDCLVIDSDQNKTYIDSVVTTQNGSIVELDDGRKVFVADNNVRSGDYVNVNGVKYRVGKRS